MPAGAGRVSSPIMDRRYRPLCSPIMDRRYRSIGGAHPSERPRAAGPGSAEPCSAAWLRVPGGSARRSWIGATGLSAALIHRNVRALQGLVAPSRARRHAWSSARCDPPGRCARRSWIGATGLSAALIHRNARALQGLVAPSRARRHACGCRAGQLADHGSALPAAVLADHGSALPVYRRRYRMPAGAGRVSGAVTGAARSVPSAPVQVNQSVYGSLPTQAGSARSRSAWE